MPGSPQVKNLMDEHPLLYKWLQNFKTEILPKFKGKIEVFKEDKPDFLAFLGDSAEYLRKNERESDCNVNLKIHK